MTLYDSAVAAINWSGNDLIEDISAGAANNSVAQASRCFSALPSTITPTACTAAGWIRYAGGDATSVIALLNGYGMGGNFASKTMMYLSGDFVSTGNAVIRRAQAINFNFPVHDMTAGWNHYGFTINGTDGNVWLNGVQQDITRTVDSAEFDGIGLDTNTSQRSSLIGAGIALWDSVLSASDFAWLADPANRPGPAASGGFPLSRLVS